MSLTQLFFNCLCSQVVIVWNWCTHTRGLYSSLCNAFRHFPSFIFRAICLLFVVINSRLLFQYLSWQYISDVPYFFFLFIIYVHRTCIISSWIVCIVLHGVNVTRVLLFLTYMFERYLRIFLPNIYTS